MPRFRGLLFYGPLSEIPNTPLVYGLPRATAECDYVTASKHLYSRQLIGESHHGRSTSSRRVVDTLSRRDIHILQGYVRLYRVVAAGHGKRKIRRRVGEGREDPCHLRSPARVACLYTHPLNGPFSGTTQVSRYQKGKPIGILLKQATVTGGGISWAICKSAPRSRQITMPAPHHSVFYRPDALPATKPIVSKH